MSLEIIIRFYCGYGSCYRHIEHFNADFNTIRDRDFERVLPEEWSLCNKCREYHCPDCALKCKEEDSSDEESDKSE